MSRLHKMFEIFPYYDDAGVKILHYWHGFHDKEDDLEVDQFIIEINNIKYISVDMVFEELSTFIYIDEYKILLSSPPIEFKDLVSADGMFQYCKVKLPDKFNPNLENLKSGRGTFGSCNLSNTQFNPVFNNLIDADFMFQWSSLPHNFNPKLQNLESGIQTFLGCKFNIYSHFNPIFDNLTLWINMFYMAKLPKLFNINIDNFYIDEALNYNGMFGRVTIPYNFYKSNIYFNISSYHQDIKVY